jgi:hypothetical protein
MKKQILKNFVTIITLSHLSFASVASVWTKDDLILKAKNDSYQTKKSFEKLYEARKNISKKVGMLLPSFSLGTILNSVGGTTKTYFMPLQLAAPMIGFAFPANWFSLKESKLIFEAEKRFYLSNVANNMNSIEVLFLEAHKTKLTINEYEKILIDLDEVMKMVHEQDDTTPIPYSSYVKLEILQQRMHSDLALLKMLFVTQKEEMGNSLAFTEKEKQEFQMKLLDSIETDLVTLPYSDFRQKSLERSVELKGSEYLIKASDFSIKKRQWEFISLTSDPEGSMGFGYKASVDIAKSAKRVLTLEMNEFNQRYLSQILETHQNHELLTNIIQRSKKIVFNAERYYDYLKTKLLTTNSNEFKEFSDSVVELLQAKSENLSLLHHKLSVEANYRRFLYDGENYRQLLPSLWLKSPEDVLSREEKRENRKINKAIKKGELKLPDLEYF